MGGIAVDCPAIECPSGADTATAPAKTRITVKPAVREASSLINTDNGYA